MFTPIRWSLLIACLGLTSVTGVEAAPIRVVLFNSCGAGGYLHPISQQTPLIKKMLLDPAGANLQNPLIPPDGFTVDSIGSTTTCDGDTTDGHQLIQALPVHDVVVCISNSDFGDLFNTEDRKAFLEWARQKGHGVAAIHGATMDFGIWPEKIAYFGADYSGWTYASAQVLADSTPGNAMNPDFLALNAGLEKTNMITDEWMSFKSQPRDVPGIHILITVNEASFVPNIKMGDHPISWYRAPADSGRLFYTAAGHDWAPFRDSYWLRRQLYNGILWASGWTPATTISIGSKTYVKTGTEADVEHIRLSGSLLTISIFQDGPHSIEVLGLDGKRVDLVRGQGRQSHTLSNLKANSVYLVLITAANGKTRRVIKTP